ncbi:hypothetical protein BD414DRAFT_494939 [Trametes punicea]|nr:hypothetical protein BD414DRAFT_494939 [Trametes punicea]
MKPSESALSCPDILGEIFSLLNPNSIHDVHDVHLNLTGGFLCSEQVSGDEMLLSTLASLSRVSWTFHHAAVRILWRNPRSLKPLISLLQLPSVLNLESISSLVLDNNSWARFDRYAGYVKELTNVMDDESVSGWIWALMSKRYQTHGPLLPRIEVLHFDRISPLHAPFVHALFSPTLTVISFTYGHLVLDGPISVEEQQASIIESIQPLFTHAPNATFLWLDFGTVDDGQVAPSVQDLQCISLFPHLACLHLDPYVFLEPPLLKMLSFLKSLQKLSIGVKLGDVDDLPLSAEAFTGLNHLDLTGTPADVATFARAIKSKSIEWLGLTLSDGTFDTELSVRGVEDSLRTIFGKVSGTLLEVHLMCPQYFDEARIDVGPILHSFHVLRVVETVHIWFLQEQQCHLSNDALLAALTSSPSLAHFSLSYTVEDPREGPPERGPRYRLDIFALAEVARRCPNLVWLSLSGIWARPPPPPLESIPFVNHPLKRLELPDFPKGHACPITALSLNKIFPSLILAPPHRPDAGTALSGWENMKIFLSMVQAGQELERQRYSPSTAISLLADTSDDAGWAESSHMESSA